MAKNKNGKVIANYDVDNRSSGYGRGSDDHFIPDVERLDAEAEKANASMFSMIMPYALIGAGVVLGAAALYFSRDTKPVRKARKMGKRAFNDLRDRATEMYSQAFSGAEAATPQ